MNTNSVLIEIAIKVGMTFLLAFAGGIAGSLSTDLYKKIKKKFFGK